MTEKFSNKKSGFVHLLNQMPCLFWIGFLTVFLAITDASASSQVELTPQEKQWIEEHPVIRLGVDPDWPPFDFMDQHGYHQGVAADFLRLVSKRLNISIEPVPDISWTEVLERAKARQLDVVSIAAITPDRSEYLSYTNPVISSSSVIVVNVQQSGISGIDSLVGKKVGVVKGYSAAELAMKTHTQLTFVEVDSVLEGLKKTATGELDAFIDNLGVVGFLISEHSLSSLRIAGDAELGALELAFGVRKDWPELVSILNKTLATITPAESRVIRNRWIPIRSSINEVTGGEASSESFEWWSLVLLALAGLIAIGVLGRVLDRPVTDGEVQRLTSAHKFWLAVTFSNLKISAKVLIMLVLVSATSVVIFGYFDYQAAKETLEKESFNKLTAVREMKAQQIENYFGTLNDLVITFTQSDTAIEAAKGFRAAFEDIQQDVSTDSFTEKSLEKYYESEFITRLAPNMLDSSGLVARDFISPNPATQYLQKTYIADNPYPTGEKDKLYRLEDGSSYDVAHTRHHPVFRKLLEAFGFYDIFILDPKDGYILYSVFKEVDYGTSLLTGPYKDSNFAVAYRMVLQNPKPGTAILVDFEPYKPSYNAPAAFIASPIFESRELVGVAIFQMPIDRINSIMTSNQSWSDVGLGKSGETYIVGEDFRMRNQSRFLIEDEENYFKAIQDSGVPSDTVKSIKAFNSTVGLQKVETRGTIAALSGQTNTEIFPDYRNIPVLSAYRPLNIQGMRWALMSEIDASEAFSSVEALKMRMLLLLAILLASIIGISFVFAKTMTRPIKVLTAKAESLAKGDLGVDISVVGGDEISHLARSFDMMRNALKELIEGLEEKVEARTAELEKSKQEIFEQEERSRLLLESVRDGIFGVDTEGKVTFINPAALELLEYKADELMGRPILPVIHHSRNDGSPYPVEECPMRAAFTEGESSLVENEVLWTKHGEAIDVEYASVPMHKGDSLVGAVILFRDIRQRKENERKIRESEREFRTMVATIPGTVYRCRPDARRSFSYISNEIERLAGLYPEDIVNDTNIGLNDLVHESDREYVLEMIDGGIKRREPYLIECRMRHTDGFTRFVYERGQAVYDANGSCEFLIGTIIDITDRKNMEKSLFKAKKSAEAAEKRISSIVANLADALIIIDTAGVVEQFSSSAEKMFGYRASEVLGNNVKMLMPSPYEENHDQYLAKYRNANASPIVGENREIIAQRKDGEIFHAELAVSETEINGRKIFIGLIKDITERKQAEEELAQAKKAAEEANKAKSSFLANMSHELRTPMNAIIGYSEMLAEDAEDDGYEDMIPDLEKITSAGKHLLALINDVLDLSKIEAGRVDLHLEDFEVPKVLNEVISTAQPLFEKNSNQVEMHIDTHVGEMHADVTKVKQVLFNLLSNAAKFTHEGKISVNASVAQREERDWLLVSVTDTGIGIPEDKLAHVFEEFSQADSSTTRDYGGTGLGLPLSRRFCQMMGGDITLRSEAGVGSTFTMEVPLLVELAREDDEVETSESTSSQADVTILQEKQRPILVIDDDPQARDLLKRTLEKDGYTIILAGSGQEGVEAARKYRPRMITLDVMMHDIDGWTVLKQLKEDPELESIPVVMVSIVADREVGFTLGAVDSLSKPVRREELIQIAHRYAGDAKSKHVLVIDDEEINRDLVKRYMREDHWIVEEAENGKAALERMEKFKPDLILLDLMMPVMDGFEFAEEVRLHPEYRSIPIIVVTAKSLDESDRKRLSGSVQRIVQKGEIGRADLLTQIEDIIHKTADHEN
jgi:PAS domain S-box-containing protein